MPFANNGQISHDPLEGGIEITDAEYQAAMAAMLAGDEVAIVDDALVTRPQAPSEAHVWQGGAWVPPPDPDPAPPTADDVYREKERRLALGFDYDFGDARGVHHFATSENDLRGWDEVSKYAAALLATADETTQIAILTDTGPATVTAPEWQQIMLASAAVRQPIWQAAFALANMSPIPADFADDIHWP